MADYAKLLQSMSTVFQTVGPIAQGVAMQREAGAEARQYEVAAGQARAAAQRGAAEERRKARLVQSRARAVAEGGASDVGVVNTMADIAAEGEYRALTALYEGEERARGYEDTAAARRYSGRQSLLSGIVAGSSTFLKEQPDLFSKYAKGKPYDFKSDGYGGRY